MRSLLDISYLKNKNANKDNFKYVKYLFIFYIFLNIFNAFLSSKFLSENFNIYLLVITTVLISFSFIFDDIIAEVYGMKNSAFFYFSMVFVRILIAVFLYALSIHTPFASYLLFAAFYHPIIYTLSWYINVRLLTKWKNLMQGKHFWLRSIGSSGIVITIFCVFVTLEDIKFSSWTGQTFLCSIILDYVLRILFIVIFSFPANFITNILKIIEHIDGTNMSETIFNPFKNHMAKNGIHS